jgi:hypothetical protein
MNTKQYNTNCVCSSMILPAGGPCMFQTLNLCAYIESWCADVGAHDRTCEANGVVLPDRKTSARWSCDCYGTRKMSDVAAHGRKRDEAGFIL